MRHLAILVSTYRLDLNLVTASEHIVYFPVRELSKVLWFLFFHSNSNHGHRFLWLFPIVTDHWQCSFNTKICFKPFLLFCLCFTHVLVGPVFYFSNYCQIRNSHFFVTFDHFAVHSCGLRRFHLTRQNAFWCRLINFNHFNEEIKTFIAKWMSINFN